MQESQAAKKKRARQILKRFRRSYRAQEEDFVRWKTPLELVVGTVLSAQCTDVRVNKVTRTLFRRYRSARAYAEASLADLEAIVKPVGFYRTKARYLKGIGKRVQERFGGRVPDSLEGLLSLPGVSFKSAYLILAKAFGKQEGIAVDTHVKRLAVRMGLAPNTTNVRHIGKALEKIYSPEQYLEVNTLFILHGRAVCRARSPQCSSCPVSGLCPYPRRGRASRKKAVK